MSCGRDRALAVEVEVPIDGPFFLVFFADPEVGPQDQAKRWSGGCASCGRHGSRQRCTAVSDQQSDRAAAIPEPRLAIQQPQLPWLTSRRFPSEPAPSALQPYAFKA